QLAETSVHRAVIASVDVSTSAEVTFRAFTDPAIYSRWLGAPVSIRDGVFAATMEWGTEIRGRYELVVPSQLIVMSWDFDDDTVPVPGRPLTGYLRVSPAGRKGSRVEVHQLVDTAQQAEFMQVAWSMVLGRLKKGVAAATNPTVAVRRRPPRPKRATTRKRAG